MIGQTINKRYAITARIGRGAMGTVYRATDTQSGREVALKVISSELVVDPDMLERFKREGEALSKLKHPNIVEFLEAFQYGENYVIVMEYVSGGSLHELISKGPLSIGRANRIALELCDALIRSHHLNIIHRDLKPENVLLAEDGTPKLADFGVARLSEGTRMTRSGTQVGTPYYMAPEAWEGKPLDAQADIWSLGVILFEMVTGQVPFGGDTSAAVMNKVLTTPPPDMKKLRAEVPLNLAQIIKQMLTRDKKRRYPTMRQLAADLERGQLSQGKVNVSTDTRGKLFRVGVAVLMITGLAAVIFSSRNLPILTSPDPTISPSQKSQDETVAPESINPAQITATSTESVIFPSTAVVNEPEKIFYDQFEERAYDGDFNRSLWIAKSSNCTVMQTHGTIEFANTATGSDQGCDLYPLSPTIFPASELGVFETQALISSDYNHKSNITQEIQFVTVNLPGGFFYAYCGLEATGSAEPTGFLNTGFYIGGTDSYQDYYGEIVLKQGFDVWHTMRLEMNSETLEISCQIDNQLVGWVVPRNVELLKSADFRKVLNASRGSGASATSYVDNVYFESPPVLAWEFNTDGDLEDWGLVDWQYVDVTAPEVSNGLLTLKATGNDPQIYTREGISLNADVAKTMWIRMRISQGIGPAELFFKTLALNDLTEDQKKQFVVQTGTEFKTYTVDLGSHSDWQGIVSQLRLDPISDYVGAIIEIDYIRLYP